MTILGRTHAATAVCAAVIMTVGATLSACGSARAAPPPKPVPTPVPTSAAKLQLPIGTYELTEPENAEEDYVSQKMLQACMQQFGFKGFLAGLSGKSVTDEVRMFQEFDSRRYGVSDPVAARDYGYHLPPWAGGSNVPKPKIPAAELTVLTGAAPDQPGRQAAGPSAVGAADNYDGKQIPSGGCQERAIQGLEATGVGQQATGRSGLAAQIRSESYHRTLTDHRVLAAFGQWSACMRAHGYDYSAPLQAATDSRWNFNAPPARTEIQTATTDVACKLKTNVLGITFAVESDYENDSIGQNAQQLAEVKAETDFQGRTIQRLAAAYGI